MHPGLRISGRWRMKEPGSRRHARVRRTDGAVDALLVPTMAIRVPEANGPYSLLRDEEPGRTYCSSWPRRLNALVPNGSVRSHRYMSSNRVEACWRIRSDAQHSGQIRGGVVQGIGPAFTERGGAVAPPGLGMAIPAGTGNTVLATLAIRPWRAWHQAVRQHTRGTA